MLNDELDLDRSTEFTHTRSDAGATRPPRILVAADTGGPPADALELARELVFLIGGELHLLLVNANKRAHSAGEQDLPAHRMVISVERHGNAVAHTEGEFVPAVAAYALELNATLIIVPGDAQRGRRVQKLVQSSKRAVLVARRKLTGMVLAATDLGDRRFPIMRQAGALGQMTRASVVAVHNVSPARVELDLESGRVTRIEPHTGATSRQLEALLAGTSTLKIPTAVLTSFLDPVDAILREARDRDASLVVVGTHLDRGTAKRSSVSSDVVNLAATSVLVVPLSGESGPRMPERVDADAV